MFPVLFALLMGIGAWMAWRRNPLYSTRSSLRSAAFVLLAVAAVIGIIVGAVNLTIHRSPAVAFSTMAAVIVFGTLSLIFIIQAVTTPPAGKLATEVPPAAKLVHIHRQKVYKWAKFFAGLLVFLGILALMIPGNPRYAVFAFGSIALLLAVILLPVMYFNARNFDRSLTALICNPWIHWQYSPEQWKQWIEVQAERIKAAPAKFIMKRDWPKLAWTFAFLAVGVLIFSPGSWLAKTLYTLGCCGTILTLVVWSTRDNRHAPERLRANLLKATPEVYFGHDGLYCGGVYTTWLSVSVYLMSASIDERPPRSLAFRFEKYVPNPYGGSQVIPILESVLIPAGAKSDLARLQHELALRCPKAQIVLA
jgi:intracellular septation protein A